MYCDTPRTARFLASLNFIGFSQSNIFETMYKKRFFKTFFLCYDVITFIEENFYEQIR